MIENPMDLIQEAAEEAGVRTKEEKDGSFQLTFRREQAAPFREALMEIIRRTDRYPHLGM